MVVRVHDGDHPGQPERREGMVDQRRGRFRRDAASPRLAGQAIADLDVVSVGHAEEQADAVERAIVLAFDDPPSGRAVVGVDALPHALHGFLARADAARAPHESHHERVLIEGHQIGLVARAEPPQPEAGRFQHREAF